MIAWLLSSEALSEEELAAVAQRIKAGEVIRPSEARLTQARRALGRMFSTDPGLSVPTQLGLLATSLLLTPLPAWVCFVWWLPSRPRAAWQSFSAALPGSVVFATFGAWLWLSPWLREISERASAP